MVNINTWICIFHGTIKTKLNSTYIPFLYEISHVHASFMPNGCLLVSLKSNRSNCSNGSNGNKPQSRHRINALFQIWLQVLYQVPCHRVTCHIRWTTVLALVHCTVPGIFWTLCLRVWRSKSRWFPTHIRHRHEDGISLIRLLAGHNPQSALSMQTKSFAAFAHRLDTRPSFQARSLLQLLFVPFSPNKKRWWVD